VLRMFSGYAFVALEADSEKSRKTDRTVTYANIMQITGMAD